MIDALLRGVVSWIGDFRIFNYYERGRRFRLLFMLWEMYDLEHRKVFLPPRSRDPFGPDEWPSRNTRWQAFRIAFGYCWRNGFWNWN